MPATLADLQAKLSDLDQKMTAMLDAAAINNGGQLGVEDRVTFDAWDAEYDKTLTTHKEWQADLDRQEARKTKRADLDNLGGRQSSHEQLTSANSSSTSTESQQFASLGEQLMGIYEVARLSEGHQMIPPELLAMLAPTGSNVSQDTDGGFLVQKDFSAELFRRTYEVGQVSSRCRSIPIGPMSDGLQMNAINETSRADGSRFGGIRAYWTGEAAQMTNTKPDLRRMELELQDLTGLWYATNRLLQDSVALQGVASAAFPEEFAFKLDDAIINGDGAGKPLGILNSGNSAIVSVTKETGQPAASIVFKNITKMWTRCWARSRQNAVWFVNQDVETELFGLNLPVGTGGLPAFLPPGGLSSSPFSTLMGRPVIPIEFCPTLGTVGDIILADMSQYLLITKGGIQSDSSIHLRFDYNETAFRWIMRINGQPLWNNVLTPFKGTSTLAPFVSLATRA